MEKNQVRRATGVLAVCASLALLGAAGMPRDLADAGLVGELSGRMLPSGSKLGRHQHVGRFDIPVDDPCLVCHADRLAQLATQFDHSLQLQRLLLSGRVSADRRIGQPVELEQIQQSLDVIDQPVFIDLVQPADREQKFAAGTVSRQPRVVGKEDDLAADVAFGIDRGPASPPANLDMPLLRLQHSGYRREQRGLAHPVGTENPDQFTGLDREVDVAEHGLDAVVLRDAGNANHPKSPTLC